MFVAHLACARRLWIRIRAVVARPEITIIHYATWAARSGTSTSDQFLATLVLATEALRARALAACSLAIGRTHIIQPSLQCSDKVLKIIPGYTVQALKQYVRTKKNSQIRSKDLS